MSNDGLNSYILQQNNSTSHTGKISKIPKIRIFYYKKSTFWSKFPKTIWGQFLISIYLENMPLDGWILSAI